MFDILSLIPSKKKKTHNGWTSFNATCCTNHGGHRPDTRSRGGLKFEGQNWVMHCFNCGFKCSFTLGKPISQNTRKYLSWLGVEELEIQRWSLESLQYKDLLDFTIQKKKNSVAGKFNNVPLPEGQELDVNNPKHKVYVDYLSKRKIDILNYRFIVTPNDEGRNSNRIVVPYYYKNRIVGNTSRFLDTKIPKYLNNQQPGYVFNTNKQKHDYAYCIVTEGIFDAISIDGVAVMHDDISDDQAELLNNLGKKIILVPDQDEAGLKMIDRALELGYSVSLPIWHNDVKDVNDAVVRYGKLPTLLSILQYATNSKIKLQMQKRKIMNGRRI
jgi:hypothetical protein